MKAYSQDLRERVLRAADQGMPHPEIVRVLGVSLATIGRYLKQRRETGQVSPKAIPGRPSKKMAALQAGLTEQLRAFPDATLEQHAQYWQQSQACRSAVRASDARSSAWGGHAKKRRWEPPNAMKKPAACGESK